MRSTIVLATIFAFATGFALRANASPDDHIRGGNSVGTTTAQKPPQTILGSYQQAIDHAGAVPGQTFAQRYWMNSQFAANSDQAPVILHICGEASCEEGYFLNDSALNWAKELGAHVVYLEHRYYGKSLPYADFSTDHLAYLTLNNAIEDLASFQKWISNEKGWRGKWIVVGGSYSGTLAAIYRQKHPELVVGALAASAPMISGVGNDQGSQSDVNDLSSIDASSGSGERPWAYQACTTFGFWVATGASFGSTLLEPSSWLCQQVFPGAPSVDKVAYNRLYNSPFIANASDSPSNILFSYGSDDVWTRIGLTQQTNANSKITIRMIQGAGHHYDLNSASSSDSPDVVAARSEFLALARRWLQMPVFSEKLSEN